MTDCHINYLSEGFYGDELQIAVSAVNIDRMGCDFMYEVINKKTSSEIARAKTSIVFFDYKFKKLKSPPQNFVNKISELPFVN